MMSEENVAAFEQTELGKQLVYFIKANQSLSGPRRGRPTKNYYEARSKLYGELVTLAAKADHRE